MSRLEPRQAGAEGSREAKVMSRTRPSSAEKHNDHKRGRRALESPGPKDEMIRAGPKMITAEESEVRTTADKYRGLEPQQTSAKPPRRAKVIDERRRPSRSSQRHDQNLAGDERPLGQRQCRRPRQTSAARPPTYSRRSWQNCWPPSAQTLKRQTESPTQTRAMTKTHDSLSEPQQTNAQSV